MGKIKILLIGLLILQMSFSKISNANGEFLSEFSLIMGQPDIWTQDCIENLMSEGDGTSFYCCYGSIWYCVEDPDTNGCQWFGPTGQSCNQLRNGDHWVQY